MAVRYLGAVLPRASEWKSLLTLTSDCKSCFTAFSFTRTITSFNDSSDNVDFFGDFKSGSYRRGVGPISNTICNFGIPTPFRYVANQWDIKKKKNKNKHARCTGEQTN